MLYFSFCVEFIFRCAGIGKCMDIHFQHELRVEGASPGSGESLV